jgi:dienelactone hydrolase
MKRRNSVIPAVLFLALITFNSIAANTTKEVSYLSGNVSCKSFVTFKESKEKMPVVLVIPEWWGCNDYAKMRANMLADLGYFAMAVDMYGEGLIANDPNEAQENAMKFYTNPALGVQRINDAISKLKEFPEADVTNIAAIGYCFGGSMVLNAAKSGVDLKAVVSFHGGLKGVPSQDGVKTKILICHGASDKFVPAEEVKAFKEDLDKAKVSYTFISYPNATHAFTNPAATETGKKFDMPISYNEAADKKSWQDMKTFFAKNFKATK